jgi:hypothetical protein
MIRPLTVALACLLFLAAPIASFAGPTSLPLEGQLDLAQLVAIGKIDRIDDVKTDESGASTGTAVIQVEEVLKGIMPSKQVIAVKVYTDIPRQMAVSMASPPHLYKAGDEGIWLIMPDGDLSYHHGLVPKERLQAVKDALAAIGKRIWSEAVDGLQAWVGFSQLEGNPPELMFAVRNTAKEPIYVPRAHYHGVVRAKVFRAAAPGTSAPTLAAVQDQGSNAREAEMRYQEIKPGETLYMHVMENYMQIILPRVDPGAYLVQVEFDGRPGDARETKPSENTRIPKGAKVFSGALLSPPVDWVVAGKPSGAQ